MAFVQVTKAAGVTREQYDQIMQSTFGGKLAEGELFRVAGPGQDTWFVIDGWSSREQCDRSMEKLMPAFMKAGLSMDSMMVDEFEIHERKTS
jgi:hypothetical protein